MDILEQRVAELERRANRYRYALVLLVVGICAAAVVGATTDEGTITGRELVLVNDRGEVVIHARADAESGEEEIDDFRQNGRERIVGWSVRSTGLPAKEGVGRDG